MSTWLAVVRASLRRAVILGRQLASLKAYVQHRGYYPLVETGSKSLRLRLLDCATLQRCSEEWGVRGRTKWSTPASSRTFFVLDRQGTRSPASAMMAPSAVNWTLSAMD